MPNESLTVLTNDIPESKKRIIKNIICFDELWNNYPDRMISHISENGNDIFDNHCAINLSHSLFLCGVLLKGYKGAKCWGCPHADSKGRGIHAIRAQELADYLQDRPFAGCPKPIQLTGGTFQAEVVGRKGIIFFKDYWRRSSVDQYTGDHIDLWNGNKLATIGWLRTWFRIEYPDFSENWLGMSSLMRSSCVLFWEINSCEDDN